MGESHFIIIPTLCYTCVISNTEVAIMQHKKSDSKGRLLLGADFANTIFIVDQNDPSKIILQKAVIIPEKEAWLHKNEAAMNSLKRGLQQAKNKQFGQDPLANNKNMSWLDEIED